MQTLGDARQPSLHARRQDAAQMIQADFAKVGVTANIYSVDWAEYLKDQQAASTATVP